MKNEFVGIRSTNEKVSYNNRTPIERYMVINIYIHNTVYILWKNPSPSSEQCSYIIWSLL